MMRARAPAAARRPFRRAISDTQTQPRSRPMKSTAVRTLVAAPLLMLLALLASPAIGAPIQFTPAQQEAVNKLTAKGGLVMQLANDSDALVVNLSLAGKQATDA